MDIISPQTRVVAFLLKFYFHFLFSRGLSCSVLTDSPSGVGEDARDGGESRGDNQDQSGGGGKGGGAGESNAQDVDSIHSSQGGDEHSITEYEIVRAVLYSNRENVNIVHECFRQVRRVAWVGVLHAQAQQNSNF